MDVKRKVNLSLNVYDLVPQNDYLYWFGFGAFHTGVVIMGQEISFGYHPYNTSGVFATQPRTIPGCTFREAIDLGEVEVTPRKLKETIEKFGKTFTGNSFHLLRRNCNHFADEFVKELKGEGIPTWINRTSWWASNFECCIPSKYLPSAPVSEEVESTSCTQCTCCQHEEEFNGPAMVLSDRDAYSPLPQDAAERRQMIERNTLDRLKKG